MFIYKTAKFAPVWTTILKMRAIFVHQTLTEHALCVTFLFSAHEGYIKEPARGNRHQFDKSYP